MPTATQIRRRYGFPITGYVSSRRKTVVGLGAITGDSRDWLISPNEGQLIRRYPMTYIGESNPAAPVGLMENIWGGGGVTRARKAFAFESLRPPQTNPAALVGAATAAATFGSVFVYDVAVGSTKYNFGKEFGGTHYPTNSAAGGCNFKMVPLPYLTPDTPATDTVTSTSVAFTRCAFEFARRFIGPGSRGLYEGGGWLFLPSLYGTPMAWNKKYNTSTSSGTEVLRAKPWGLYPPLAPPTYGGAQVASSADKVNWQDGDSFYFSVMFQMDDGSFSKPWVPRSPGTASGLSAANGGLVTVGTIGGSTGYESITWNNIPIGPYGTRARILLRTRKARILTTGDSPTLPAPERLYITAVIQNNVQTSYTDYSGSDDGLRDDSLALRFDHIWPPAARTAFEFERRCGIGFTRTNPCAIILAPTGVTSSRDLNLADDAAGAYGVNAFSYRIVGTAGVGGSFTFQWRKIVISSGVVTTGTKALAANLNLQQLVDYINENATIGSGSEWKAQLVPGVDGNIPSTKLQFTSVDVASLTVSSSGLVNGSAGVFADIAVGSAANVISGTASIPAGTIVVSKTSNAVLQLGSQTGGSVTCTAGSATITFSSNTGDDALFTVGAGDSSKGNIRAYCPAFPAVIAFRGSYLDTLPIDKSTIYFTASPPGQASSAPQSFFNALSNRRGVPSSAGSFLAGAPVGKRAILCYTNAIYLLDNQRGGTTGEDFDFHPYPGNITRGCIAPASVVSGNGWAGYLTRDGYVVADITSDSLRERLLSADLFDPAQSTAAARGVLAGVIATGIQYPDPDGRQFIDQGNNVYAAIIGGALNLVCPFSVLGGTSLEPFRIVYDFRSSIESSGLQQVLRSIGPDEQSAQAFGWSSPLTQPLQSLVGPVVANATYAFVDYASSLLVPDPSTGDLTMVRVDFGLGVGGNVGRDEIYQQSIQCNLNPSSNQISSTLPNGFLSVAVGARVTGHANIQAGTTVTAKGEDGNSITLSLVTTNSTQLDGQSVTFTGKEVMPIAYLAMDACDLPREKKVAHRITTLHRVQSNELLRIGYVRDRGRAASAIRTLRASGSSDNVRQVVEMPVESRSPAEVIEFSVSTVNGSRGVSSNQGFPAEFWGLDAEIEIVDSPT